MEKRKREMDPGDGLVKQFRIVLLSEKKRKGLRKDGGDRDRGPQETLNTG